MKSLTNRSGIYQIRNITNDKIYIGSAINIRKRYNVHTNGLRNNKHHSPYLQRAWNKYGKENFVCEVLFTCPKEDLVRLEQYHINNYQPQYNISPFAGNQLGYKHTDQTKLKMSNSHMGKKHDPVFVDQYAGHRYRPVVQICPSTLEIIQEFKSTKSAAEFIGCYPSGITEVCKGKYQHCKGFKWKYKNEITNGN